VNYSYETSDIFCDQLLSPVDVVITSETATIEFQMLEITASNLEYAINQYTSHSSVSANKIGVGGMLNATYVPLMLTIPDNDTGLLTTWTFYRVRSGGMSINFERENPSTVNVTFTAYAETSHASGHQLFSINQALTA
jgi:hypothetical protein